MSSKSIYTITEQQRLKFQPTYLYVKQHSITGLKYFGKTIQNPIKYLGSGKYWKPHIEKHGKEYVETIWFHIFNDIDLLVEFALFFSEEYNIFESNNWANQKPENGLDGGTDGSSKKGELNPFYGKTHTDETKNKMCGRKCTEENKLLYNKLKKGVSDSEETRKKKSISKIGKLPNSIDVLDNVIKQKFFCSIENKKEYTYINACQRFPDIKHLFWNKKLR
jgi:hypothetical protein